MIADARTDGTLALRQSVYPETRFIEAERQTRRHLAVCVSVTTVVSFYKQPQKRLKHSGHLGRVHGKQVGCIRLGLFLMGCIPMRRGARVAFTVSGWGPEVTEGSYTEEAVYGEAPHSEAAG